MNSDNPSIQFSVIIPIYNSQKTIFRAIDSVLAQSYPAMELIVIDDASTDGTGEMVNGRYGDKIRYIQKLTNQGSGGARNAGLDVATGNYVAFLDSDDIWHPDKLMLISTILESNPGISLFYHPFTQEEIAQKKLPENIMLYRLPFVKLLPGNMIATSCAVIKNDPKFRFDPLMRHTEDYDLWLRIGYKHKVYFINIPLTQIFRPFLSQGGVSAAKWKMRKGEMRAYSKLTSLNPLFILMLPALWLSSLGKHLVKMITPKA
ncbi:MAG: glycosyltransferase family A protein [Bacteroidota bacterium]